jgi:SAM-dependent methyltransferase
VTSGHDPRVDIQTSLERASNYNRWIADQIGAHVGDRVLDAGCGSGNLTRLLLDREFVAAVDVWDAFVEVMTERFGDAGNLAVHRFDLSDPEMSRTLEQYQLDSAYCVNVLEHIEDDRAALTNLAASIVPGGSIFLLVPAFPALYGEHDRADHHFRRYTKRSLAETVAPLPLEIERCYYMNLPGFFAWFLVVRLMKRRLNEESIGLYDKLIPAIRRVETVIAPPFGQSLVALLRSKRET